MTTDDECRIILGKRDPDGRVWCQTCMCYVAILPRTETERFFGEPPVRVRCPRQPSPAATIRP